MTVSNCCGAATKVEYRPDRPFVYDDQYDLQVPVLVCTKCGKVIGLDSNEAREDGEK
jgi:Fe2+ or Zn2+ uptake regulation protein